RSREYGRPAGVAFSFQVSLCTVEPALGNRALNLLPKHRCRPALRDEARPRGPQVARIGEAPLGPDGAEGLAGAGSGPHWLGIGPSSEAQGERPSPDSGEEVALGESPNVHWRHILDAPLIDFPWGDE